VESHGRLKTLKPIWKTPPFYVQSLRSEISPEQWIRGSSRALQAFRKELTGSASQEGSRRLLRSQPRCLGFGHRNFLLGLGIGTFYLAPTHLVAVLDGFSRFVLSWALKVDFCIEALNCACGGGSGPKSSTAIRDRSAPVKDSPLNWSPDMDRGAA
jgi:hypothetical protein